MAKITKVTDNINVRFVKDALQSNDNDDLTKEQFDHIADALLDTLVAQNVSNAEVTIIY